MRFWFEGKAAASLLLLCTTDSFNQTLDGAAHFEFYELRCAEIYI